MFRAYLRLIRFDKPIGTLLLLWPTLWALWIAYQGLPPAGVLFAFCAGVFFTRAAGCAINDFADSEFDSQVKRTVNRPLATGEISKKQAILVTIAFSLLAFIVAIIFLKPATIIWSIPALFIFLTYPYLKRFFPIPQAYLGIAFSFGIPMAFIESSGHLPFVVLVLFLANFLWVLAYDTIYALVDIDDDLKIGIKTSAITFGSLVIEVIMASYTVFILLLVVLGVAGRFHWIYFAGVVAELYLITRIYLQIRAKERERCFQAFLYNNNIGLVLFILIVLNYMLG